MRTCLNVNNVLKKLKYDIDKFTTRAIQLRKVVSNESDFQNMSDEETYAHIRALRMQLNSSTNFLNDRWKVADDIINGWEMLNKHIESDEELKDDWNSFMCIMRLKE